MKLNELKQHLSAVEALTFVLPSQETVPAHFHITEIGLSAKHFVDCGGTIREDKSISFQIWYANDIEHRLSPEKFLSILEKAKPLYQDQNLDIEVEYQTEWSIGKFGLSFDDNRFILTPQYTTCLAIDHCGIPEDQMLVVASTTCAPNSGCC